MYYIFKTLDGRPRVSYTPHEPEMTDVPLELVEETEIDPKFVGNEIWVDGGWKSIDVSPEYRRLRKADYPSVEEQLDALWHAMDDGSTVKAEAFYERIKNVKDRYPKTEIPTLPNYASDVQMIIPDE
tara:strand:- start:1641 stop:2021 length:381 start_codon:yes stop_codon:yes gene_type:complete